jgi:hypothetical protein
MTRVISSNVLGFCHARHFIKSYSLHHNPMNFSFSQAEELGKAIFLDFNFSICEKVGCTR